MSVPFTPKRMASLLWSGANQIARYARERGLLTSEPLPVPTVGIGNVQAGGAGKTPLTIRLARDAIAAGYQVAVLLRGYRGAWERSGGILSPYEPSPSPALCGDEAALIRDQVPGVWIGVGADRSASFEKLASSAQLRTGRQFDLAILDDAYQHWRVRCDRYVVAVTDAKFGDRVFRDDYSAIGPEDVVVLTKGEAFPDALAKHPNRVRAHYRLNPGEANRKYRFVAAIGDPERARRSLTDAGYVVRDMTVFPDHHAFSLPEIEKILEEADSTGTTVVLSGKDWVKWRALGIEADRVAVVEPEIEIVEGEAIWRGLVGE
ncbi:MAG: tetraacyldisaccharide 4'-kinase [Bdellovibrionales bacterium]|nr:tetraacyldisaccharide 4'-kinase [Bdellovibrionales bacterium]